MKFLLSMLFFLMIFHPALAQGPEHFEEAIIHSIDDHEEDSENYVEVSEEGLPQDHYARLLELMNSFQFTHITESKARSLFRELTKDPQARMQEPGGKCSYRRSYIQNYLKKRNIISGKLYIHCPGKNGRLRLKDQVSGRYYTYVNFHDSNIVAIKNSNSTTFMVMDLQFMSAPGSLHDFLTGIEQYQKIRPSQAGENDKNYCYWSISTPFYTY